MKPIRLLAAALVPPLLASPLRAETASEAFDAAPDGWTLVSDTSSFGHSPTNTANGLASGEAGGAFLENDSFEYYADTTRLAGGLDEQQAIHASGRIYVGDIVGEGDEGAVGHFHTTSANLRDDLVGFSVKDRDTDSMRFRFEVRRGGVQLYTGQDTAYFAAGSVFDWEYEYDPTTSQLTGSFTLVSGSFEDSSGNPTAATEFSDTLAISFSSGAGPLVNAFGLGSLTRSSDVNTRGWSMFIDDATYAVPPTPQEAPAAQPPIHLEQLWYGYADPGGEEHPSAPLNPLTGLRDALETDRGDMGCESAVISPDGTLVITASRSNGATYPDTPAYVHALNGNTAHLRLWDIEGNLLWDRARSRGADINGDGYPDDQPADRNDEIEHAEFTIHPSNRGRYVVAAGEDDKIEVWEVTDAQGEVLAAPVLTRTLTIPDGRAAAFDSLGFNNSGELLTGGTEFKGHLEVWRATGHPSTWEHVGHASHGDPSHAFFQLGKAVNEFDYTSDDEYMLMAGSDEWGSFWDVEITRDGGTGEITAVDFTRLASMPQPNRSSKAARILNLSDRLAIIASKDQRTIVFAVDDLIAQGAIDPFASPDPALILNNGIYHGVDNMTGVEIEPGGASNDGRFFVVGGGPEENFGSHPNSAGYQSSFFRFFEAAEIVGDASSPDPTEPDPVWVQPAFHTEFFFFNADDSLLATAHDDGTARLWRLTIPGTSTLAAEGFNAKTGTHSRWSLS